MRYVRAFDKTTGAFVERQDATTKNEHTRYSHDYRCLNEKCGCTHHWRQAVGAKENTDPRPATFVKNPSSEHILGCRYDFSAFADIHHRVSEWDGDMLNFRINFPLGATGQDLNPTDFGQLSPEQRRAANDNLSKKGFGSLAELFKFVAEHYDGLDDPALDQVTLLYQGKPRPFRDVFVPSDHYGDLIKAAQMPNEYNRTPVTLSIVKPISSFKGAGITHVVCDNQYGKPNSKQLNIRPIIRIPSGHSSPTIQQIIENNQTMVIATRPVLPSKPRGRFADVYLDLARLRQIDTVPEDYWRQNSGPDHQGDLFMPNQKFC